MKIFLDSASLNEINTALSWGVLDGITTNPSLILKDGLAPFQDITSFIRDVCRLIPERDISIEVTTTQTEQMIQQGIKLAAVDPNVVIKIPLTHNGLQAIRRLNKKGIRTNCTLCFSATQALLAAKAGATFISPFIGRLDDFSNDGLTVLGDIITIYSQYNFKCQVLAASLRHPIHVLAAAKLGADIATMPLSVLKQIIHHPLTDKGLKQFMDDCNCRTVERLYREIRKI